MILTRGDTLLLVQYIHGHSCICMCIYLYVCICMCVYMHPHTYIHLCTAVSYGWDSVVACFSRPKSLAKSGVKEGKKHG